MDKAERLAQIMFEDDEIRYNNNEETIYFIKEDFEAEQKERKNRMTVRELINILLNYEADEVIDFFLLKEDYTPRIIIKEVSKESDLPYIEFKEV